MKAVVLAAGLGTRMRPLTFTRPKFLLPVGGKPALDRVIELLREAGLKEIGMVVGYGREMIQERYQNGKNWGVSIEYLIQEELLGTADAVAKAERFVGEEDFLVMNGDVFLDQESLNSFLEYYKEAREKPSFAGCLAIAETEHPEQFGVVQLEDGNVVKIIEKPTETKLKYTNAGIYIFTKEIFEAIRKTPKSERGEYELTSSIQNLVDWGRKITAFKIKLWGDLGRPWDLLVANEYFLKKLKGEIHGRVEVGAFIGENVYVGEGTRIRSGSYIEGPTYIGRNCDIGPNCFIRPYTTICDYVRVGNGVEIKNSILMDHTNVAHLSYVGDSVIGSYCNLGAGTTIANLRLDEEEVKMEVGGEIVSTGRRKMGTIIADHVKTGVNCMINPGVKIGPYSAVGPGAVVYEDVPAETMILVKTILEVKKWTPPKGEKHEL
ncbi:MAG: sugar phosphate nucleotidyltransferase [Candidatus Hadarchaeales archaeon]